MNFVDYIYLWMILAVLPLVVWFLWWTWRTRQKLMRQFVSERLLPQLLEGYSPGRQKIKLALVAGSILFLLLALARPQWGFVWEEASSRGRDILVAIDTSRSMLAEDMAPNRLGRAKLASLDLLRMAKNDRLGLIAFAGGAFLQSPLTLDDEAFRQNVSALDTTIIPQGGTSLSEAIDTALTTFETEEGENHKVLVIFTDGEDQDTGAMEAAERAAKKGLRIFTVGVGTPAGEILKITDESGKSGFIKDASGNVVKSRLNEDLLRQIATKANGFYLALREGNAMQALYQRGLEPLPTSDVTSKLVRHLNEQFHWPLGIAIALLLAEILLPSAPKRRKAASTAKQTAVAALVFFLFPVTTEAASPGRAFRNYQSGNYKDARNEYEQLLEKRPDDPRLNYNAGAAAYKAGAYDAAVKDFNAALKAEDLSLQQMAYYNLGNSNFKLGDEETDPQKKMAFWQQAVQNFDSSLKLNTKDQDATFNRDLVKKRLEELKKQQQQEQKQDQNKDNKDEKKDDQKQDQKDQQQKQEDKDQNQKDQEKKDNQDSKSDQEKKDEEKKQQEQQSQDQKDQANQDKKDSKQQDGKDQADQESDPKSEAEKEARAMQLGQMTPKQAQQMLDAQKTEEKALIYRQALQEKKGRERLLKDW